LAGGTDDPAAGPGCGCGAGTTDGSLESSASVIFHEWVEIYKDVRKAKGLKNKWLYLTKPPGWSPDGSTMTSKELRDHIKQVQNK
jgi:hypothetical protein